MTNALVDVLAEALTDTLMGLGSLLFPAGLLNTILHLLALMFQVP